MTGIPVYDPLETDFSMNGRGLLFPTSCVAEWTRNGPWELTMALPMDDDLRWTMIGSECILKVPVSMRESPLYEQAAFEGVAEEEITVVRQIYRVKTRGSRLNLRAAPDTSARILGSYKPGTEVVKIADAGSANGHQWMQVTLCSGGAAGYMAATYLAYARDITETMTRQRPVTMEGVQIVQQREQLFRCSAPLPDTTKGTVSINARHIFFDLCHNLIGADYAPEGVSIREAATTAFAALLDGHPFRLHVYADGEVTGDYGWRNFVDALVNESDGMLAQAGAVLVLDNFDIFILPAFDRDMGVTIRRGKNLNGVKVHFDDGGAVTRIVPVGRDADGNPLRLDGCVYIDSPRIGNYAVIRSAKIEYDVEVGDGDGQFADNSAARAELRRLAQADFDGGIDLPEYSLEVDFVQLKDSPEYAELAPLQAVHPYDVATVIDEEIGLTARVGLSYVKEDVLSGRYDAATLGDVQSVQQTVTGYSIAAGTLSGTKLIPGTVAGAMLRDVSIGYAKIAHAAIEQLTANSLTAVAAQIQTLVAGKITAEAIVAGAVTAEKIAAGSITAEKIAAGSVSADKIAAGSVTAEKVAAGAITAEKIAAGAVSAQSIEAVTAALGRLTAGEIQTDRLYAALAHVIELAAVSISAGQVETDQLAAALARVVTLQAGTGSFDFATVQNLVAGAMSLELGCAGTVAVKNLLVSSANLLNAVIGGLVLKSANGRYYTVTVGSDGALGAEETTVSAGEIAASMASDGRNIVETSANIENLAAGTILGQRAVLNSILTTALTAGSITASEALLASASVPALYTTAIRAIGNSLDLSANESIRLIVGQAAEDRSRVFRQEEAPEGARDGDLWIQPSCGRTWQYCAGAAAAPVFALGEDGQLAYGYADGETAYPLRINDDGWLEMDADAPFQFDQDHTGSVWLLVVDTDMIDSRLTSAESAIVQTAEQIELTVKRVDTVQTAVGTAQSTANSAQSAANSAQSAANANASNISALTTRVTEAESSITQTAEQIASTVKRVDTVQTAVGTAQSTANSAQSTANSKRRVFVSTPTPPYDAGDLWVQGTSGDIMRCQTAKASGGSYAASDWVRASKYTDDTAANAAQSAASSAQSTANSAQSAANANASNISALTTRVSASETAISQNASAISLRATKAELSALETRVETAEIAVEPDSIAAVVKKKVAFGGTNLLLNSAFRGLTGAGVYSFDGDVAVFSSSVTGVTSNVAFSNVLSGDVAQARGREITFSVDYRVDSAISYGTSNPWVGAQIALYRPSGDLYLQMYGGKAFPTAVTGKWIRAAQTFSVPDAEISSGIVALWFRDASGTVRFRHPKLEIGGVATEWSPSPEDPGQSLNTYSGVRIDQDEIHLVSAKTTIAVPGSSGEDDVARFDSEGVHAQIVEADTINSPSVVAAQGAATFAPANAGELAAIAENLKNVCLTGDVTINTSALTGGTLNLTGMSGGHTLKFSGGTLNGANITGCSARIEFVGVTFATSGAALTLDDGRNVVVSGGALNAGTGVLARRGSRIRVDSCGGVCDYAAYSRELSEVTFTGTAPGTDMPYGAAQTALGGQIYAGARLIPKPSSEPEPEKPTVQTVTLTPTLTRSWNGSWRDGYWLFQGRYGTKNLNRGCMWFSTSDFAGKTIISAALSMKRKTGAGKGSAVTVKICGTTATGASGTPEVGTQYASVSIGRNERRSVDVTSAVKALASGSIRGLMLYDSSTGNISSSDPYTEGYAQLYGSDSGDRPVLTVTYQ